VLERYYSVLEFYFQMDPSLWLVNSVAPLVGLLASLMLSSTEMLVRVRFAAIAVLLLTPSGLRLLAELAALTGSS